MSRPGTIIALTVLLVAPARADKGFGVAAGVGLPLEPVVQPGIALGLSSVLTGMDPRSVPGALLHLRGEVLGIWSPDEDVAAVLPLLSGDLGVEVGPLQLYLTGGVQIFGGAWRADHTFFTAFGLLGGGGMTVHVHPKLALEARCSVVWIPSATAARIKEPDPAPGSPPTLLFLSGLVGIVMPL